MKKICGIYSKIISKENLYRSSYMAARGRRYRDTTADFNFRVEEEIDRLHRELSAKTYTVSVITVTNEGNVRETYWLKISSVTLYDNSSSLWKSTDTTTGTGYNRFVFYAIFHGTDVALGYFKANDIVVEESRFSTSVQYTHEEGSTGYEQTGVGIPSSEERKIWFRLDMPTSTTTGKKEKIRVTVTAGPE